MRTMTTRAIDWSYHRRMRRGALSLLVLLAAGLVASCGPPVFNPAQQELGRKHCNANADCASGLCRDGLCG